ncbi:rna-directed dna polymerase from mobile element jockey-like [Pitangus sulphuratus]|nr:rna-directed dna polymerase from mobile element jockey-like [Pitangus sulphuratus]
MVKRLEGKLYEEWLRRLPVRNYRPISLTSVPGKLTEKTTLGGIEKRLKDNTIIGPNQHSLMGGKSCLSKLISFYDKVTHLVDQGKPSDVIFLDFSKDFDTVCHRILLDSMSSTQFDEYILWGSILGPTLFNIFINDLDTGLEGILSKFADHAKLGGAVDSLKGRRALQRDLNKLESWAITNHMKFNKEKCWILHLGWGNLRCARRLRREMLEGSAMERDLGVLVDGKLNLMSWQPGGPTVSWGAKHWQPVKEGDYPALLFTVVASPGILCAVLDTTV